jgi:hypothetical protein
MIGQSAKTMAIIATHTDMLRLFLFVVVVSISDYRWKISYVGKCWSYFEIWLRIHYVACRSYFDIWLCYAFGIFDGVQKIRLATNIWRSLIMQWQRSTKAEVFYLGCAAARTRWIMHCIKLLFAVRLTRRVHADRCVESCLGGRNFNLGRSTLSTSKAESKIFSLSDHFQECHFPKMLLFRIFDR